MKAQIRKIKLLALDVDGVLTDGRIILNSEGQETKNFDVLDGLGIVLFRQLGYKTAIISARSAKCVEHRANDLKIDKVYQDARPKRLAYEQMLKDFHLQDKNVCFIGDDLPDLPLIKRVGFGVAVANAPAEVKKSADYVTKNHGGRGAVREVIEMILKAQGQWPKIMKLFA